VATPLEVQLAEMDHALDPAKVHEDAIALETKIGVRQRPGEAGPPICDGPNKQKPR
jgi:hypothetical protein